MPARLWMCTHICSVLILIIFPKTSTHNKKISIKQWGKRTSTLCELLPATSKICWLIASFAGLLAAIYFKTQVRAETIATMLKQQGKQNHTYYLHENVQTYRNSAVSLYMCREMPLSGVFRRGGKKQNKRNRVNNKSVITGLLSQSLKKERKKQHTKGVQFHFVFHVWVASGCPGFCGAKQKQILKAIRHITSTLKWR